MNKIGVFVAAGILAGAVVATGLWFYFGDTTPDGGGERGGAPVGSADPRQTIRYKESHALLIGMSHYSKGWDELATIPQELNQVKTALEKHQFQVQIAMNLTLEELQRNVRDFISQYGIEKDNRLLLYFAGHGYSRENGKRGYFIPVDSPLPDRDLTGFVKNTLSMEQILTWAREIEAKHVLFVFDSCFSGTVFKARGERVNRVIDDLTNKQTRQFITAGMANETVPAKSVFTSVFVDALAAGLGDLNMDGFITGTELGLYLRHKVPEFTHQTPQFGSIQDYELSQGDFVFSLNGAAALPAVHGGETPGTTPEVLDEHGYLQVNVNVIADVYLSDILLGQADPDNPLSYLQAPPGPAVVRVEAPDYITGTQQTEIKKGKWSQLVMVLEPVPVMAKLSIKINVEGAMIFLNGQNKVDTGEFVLPAGDYRVRVEKQGYTFFEDTVQLKKEENRRVDVVLTPIATAAPNFITIRADKTNILDGDTVTLVWEAENSEAVLVNGKRMDVKGSMRLQPNNSTDMNFTALGKNGEEVKRSIHIDVILPAKPIIDIFSVIPLTIIHGQSVEMQWKTHNGDYIAITNVGNVTAGGKKKITPASTTTYTLSVRNQAGDVATQSVTVEVEALKISTGAFFLPGDGVRHDSNKIGPFCCGETKVIKDNDDRTVGYVNLSSDNIGAIKLSNKHLATVIAVGVSGLKDLSNADAGLETKWIRVPVQDAAPNLKKTLVAGGLRVELAFERITRLRVALKEYYLLGSLKVKVTPDIPLAINPDVIRLLDRTRLTPLVPDR